MFCTGCGNRIINETSKFCNKCGKPVIRKISELKSYDREKVKISDRAPSTDQSTAEIMHEIEVDTNDQTKENLSSILDRNDRDFTKEAESNPAVVEPIHEKDEIQVEKTKKNLEIKKKRKRLILWCIFGAISIFILTFGIWFFGFYNTNLNRATRCFNDGKLDEAITAIDKVNKLSLSHEKQGQYDNLNCAIETVKGFSLSKDYNLMSLDELVILLKRITSDKCKDCDLNSAGFISKSPYFNRCIAFHDSIYGLTVLNAINENKIYHIGNNELSIGSGSFSFKDYLTKIYRPEDNFHIDINQKLLGLLNSTQNITSESSARMCPVCNGSGTLNNTSKVHCRFNCINGVQKCYTCNNTNNMQYGCSRCGGTGSASDGGVCLKCGGVGRISKSCSVVHEKCGNQNCVNGFEVQVKTGNNCSRCNGTGKI